VEKQMQWKKNARKKIIKRNVRGVEELMNKEEERLG
jgi:hypothetical protein